MDAGFFDTLRGFKFTSKKHRIADDDFVDRLNHYYTPLIIVIFSIIICAKQYIVGEPLQCWVPAHFPGSWEQYAENYCWVKNTYMVLPSEDIPDTHDERRDRELTYYQWVPFVLALQALLFYMPCLVWRLLNLQSGINVKNLVQMAITATNVDPNERHDTICVLTRHIEYAIIGQRKQNVNSPSAILKIKRILFRILCCGYSKQGNYLTFLYVVTKIFYLLNIVCQFTLMTAFLGTSYTFYGYNILKDLVQGREWHENGHFPRVTLCDFAVRVLGNLQKHTIQCVLVINLFNEKIFIFLWFWFVLIALVTSVSTVIWLLWIILPGRRASSIEKYLTVSNRLSDQRSVTKFVDNYLCQDGVFVLKIVALNAGEAIAHDLVLNLWENYENKDKLSNLSSSDIRLQDLEPK